MTEPQGGPATPEEDEAVRLLREGEVNYVGGARVYEVGPDKELIAVGERTDGSLWADPVDVLHAVTLPQNTDARSMP